ncbi:MAG: transglutaminase domain-containing protein [Desulfatibacillaceae bacterium]
MARKIGIHHILAPLFLMGFAVLIALRLGAFTPHTEPGEFVVKGVPLGEHGLTSWLNILQGGNKIGYAQRSLVRTVGGYETSEAVFMRLNTLGTVQDINYRSRARLAPDMTLVNFDFTLGSALATMRLSGRMVEGDLVVRAGRGEDATEMTIPVEEPPFLGGSLMYTAAVVDMEPGDSASFPVFDPATMSRKRATVHVEARETVDVMGEPVDTRRVRVEYAGSEQKAWVSDKGEVVAEEGALGLRLEKVAREVAIRQDYEVGETEDIMEAASIESDVVLDDPAGLSYLKVRVSGSVGDQEQLSGGRQAYSDGVLTVVKETLPEPGSHTGTETAGEEFVGPGSFVQSDSPRVAAVVEEIVEPGDSDLAKARRIVDWMYENIEKIPVVSIPDALTTLSTRRGDCNEHAVLTAALARAAGVPARIEIGVVYLRGRFFYHAWNAFFLEGQWITADTVFGQMPADVTHLRLARGNFEAQVEMMAYLGRLKLSVLEYGK